MMIKFIDLLFAIDEKKTFSTFQRFFIRTPIAFFDINAGFNDKYQLFNHPEFIKASEFLKNNPEIDIVEMWVEFINYGGLVLSCADGFLAKLSFESRGRPWDQNSEITILVYEEIKNIFSIANESKAYLDQADANTKGILTAYSENIEQLQSLSSKLLVFYSEERQKLESDFIQKRNNLEQEIESKNQQAERRRLELIEQFEIEKQEFDQAKRQFDDSKNTHARRQLLGRIETVLNEKTSSNFSPDTVKKYESIEAALKWFSIGLFCLAGLWLSLFLLYLSKDVLHYEFMASFGASFIAGSLIVIWIVKLRFNWYSTHSQSEITNRQFVMNMLRASWVVEMYYEWKDEKGVNMDQTLIERLTKGLFENPKESRAVEHPAEEILKSLSDVKKFKVDKDGIEVEK